MVGFGTGLRSVAGQRAPYVLRSGDVYRVPNRENLTLLAGNAGGLEILVDGRVMPPLGPLGVVRRDISLNVDTLLGARHANG